MTVSELENRIINADCLDILKELPDKCIDLVLTDPPYGVTRNEWDVSICLSEMWSIINRVAKENAAIIIFGQDKFSARCMLSNKNHRYNLIWVKGQRVSGFLNAHKMPLRNHEDIMVFYDKQPTYNPQMEIGKPLHSRGTKKKQKNNNYGKINIVSDERNGSVEKFPKSVLVFDRPHPPIHPTQKPVELFEYLVKTYSNENDLVLDCFSGSGTTAVACHNLKRRFICIEKDPEYWAASVKRLEEAQRQLTFNF